MAAMGSTSPSARRGSPTGGGAGHGSPISRPPPAVGSLPATDHVQVDFPFGSGDASTVDSWASVNYDVDENGDIVARHPTQATAVCAPVGSVSGNFRGKAPKLSADVRQLLEDAAAKR